MRNLLLGIIDFRKTLLPQYKGVFQKLATSQAPDCIFFACADSRVVPNMFASTKPGELFMIRNVGNLVPPCGHEVCNHGNHSHNHNHAHGDSDSSIGAALEFSSMGLKVKDIIVCGHSNCGAMKALIDSAAGKVPANMPHLVNWLKAGQPSLEMFQNLNQGKITYRTEIPGLENVKAEIDTTLPAHDQLSQINAMWQLENLMTYQPVKERVLTGDLRLHCWWFDIGNADIYSFSMSKLKFVLLDESKAQSMINKYFDQQDSYFIPGSPN
eukprot:TRINITY_DN3203_c0_g1_i4.p1 TRINITY_DN3203_c0_g1~~TRINITY_DN3203_c0_g1_i4.p1  ORF type:complete len:269 (-),score=86.22 TRINITY_DN3203_c0_g1_i4:128-934(-)